MIGLLKKTQGCSGALGGQPAHTADCAASPRAARWADAFRCCRVLWPTFNGDLPCLSLTKAWRRAARRHGRMVKW